MSRRSNTEWNPVARIRLPDPFGGRQFDLEKGRGYMHIYNSLDEAKSAVVKAQGAMGLPIDDAGVRKLLVSLRALDLIDWIEPKPVASDNEAESRRVKV